MAALVPAPSRYHRQGKRRAGREQQVRKLSHINSPSWQPVRAVQQREYLADRPARPCAQTDKQAMLDYAQDRFSDAASFGDPGSAQAWHR
jgi:hypothetical protein